MVRPKVGTHRLEFGGVAKVKNTSEKQCLKVVASLVFTLLSHPKLLFLLYLSLLGFYHIALEYQ